MDSDSIDEICSLPRSSSSSSLPSSLGLYELSMYSDPQICLTDSTEDGYVVLPDPIHQETYYRPLVICDTWSEEHNGDNNDLANLSNALDEQLQPSIGCEVPLDREGLSDQHQYPEPSFLGTQTKTDMQLTQSLERELCFWKNKSSHLMEENNNAISKARVLEKQMMELKMQNQYLVNCNFYSTIQACELRNKVDNLELKDAQRDLIGVETRFAELNDQMVDFEDEFTELKNEAKQFMVRFFSPKTKVTGKTFVCELKDEIDDFKDFWDEFKEFWADLRRDVFDLKLRAADLEMRSTLPNNSVVAFVMDVTDQEMQMAQSHERIGKLDGRLVRLQKLMEILDMEFKEEMELEEAGSQSASEADNSKHWQLCLIECMRLCKQSLLNCRLFNIIKLVREKDYELAQKEAFDDQDEIWEDWEGNICNWTVLA